MLCVFTLLVMLRALGLLGACFAAIYTLHAPHILSTYLPQTRYLDLSLQCSSFCAQCASVPSQLPKCCRLLRWCRPGWQTMPSPPQWCQQLRPSDAGSAASILCLACAWWWRAHPHVAAADVHDGIGSRLHSFSHAFPLLPWIVAALPLACPVC